MAKILLWLIAHFQYRYKRLRDQMLTIELSQKIGKCGKNVRISYPCNVLGAEFMEIGNNVHINQGAFIRAQGGLTINDNTHIARNLVIYTINHNYNGDALPYDHSIVNKPVVIERNVWIGINVTIIPGVTIGEGAIIGAGTVVSQDIPPMAIVGSQPPRIIKYRDKAKYEILEKAGKYGGVGGRPLKNIANDKK